MGGGGGGLGESGEGEGGARMIVLKKIFAENAAGNLFRHATALKRNLAPQEFFPHVHF